MSQIFKTAVLSQVLMDLLEQICVINNDTNKYVFNLSAYKKGVYLNVFVPFLETIRPNYYVSKQKKYIDCPLTYKSLTTIIRQICNYNNISYDSKIKYDKSKYEIVYYILRIL